MLLALDSHVSPCVGFLPSTTPSTLLSALERRRRQPKPPQTTVLSSSPSSSDGDANNADGDDSGRTNVDAMRSLLESSWNVGTMGEVPTSPESAARAASHSIAAALAAQPRRRLLQVDIRLPSFDVRQGPNVYDDVQSVEFCCQLAENLRRGSNGGVGKALILVRDGSAVRSAARILDVKERRRKEEQEGSSGVSNSDAPRDTVDEDDDELDEDDELPESSDDDGDGIDAFRKQLSLTWGDDDGQESNGEEGGGEPQIDPSEAAAAANRARRGREKLQPSVNFNPEATEDGRSYRLVS